MNGTELKEKITQLNSVAKTLNTRRQQDIGKRETLTKQIEDMIEQYNKTYNKNITIDTLEAELESVKEKKEKEVEKVSGIINAIQTGDYALANKLAGIETDEKTASANTGYVESVVNNTQNEVTQQPSTPSMYTQQEEVAEPAKETTTPVQEAVTSKPSMPNVSPVSNPIDIDSGKTHNPGIFGKDFSKSDEVAPPVAPPSLADLL